MQPPATNKRRLSQRTTSSHKSMPAWFGQRQPGHHYDHHDGQSFISRRRLRAQWWWSACRLEVAIWPESIRPAQVRPSGRNPADVKPIGIF